MKKLVFILLAFLSLTAFSQNVTQKAIIDSVHFSTDSIPTLFFKIVKITKDTTAQAPMTYPEITRAIRVLEDRVRFADQSYKVQKAFMRDSITDAQAKQYVLQLITMQSIDALAYKAELDRLKAIKNAWNQSLK
jgi:hypothetical protein